MEKKYNLIFNILFLVISFFFAIYVLQYSILFDHDLVYPFFRNLFTPEHGRYVATYASSLLVDHIPVFFNVHPNDFLQTTVVPIKAFLIVLFVCLISNSIFFFQNQKLKLFHFDCPFYPIYIVFFLLFFSQNYFLDYEYMQVVVFFEYPMSLLPLFILILCSLFYYVHNEVVTLKSYTILLILLFFVGLTIEPINLSVFLCLTLILLFLLIKNKFSFDLNKKFYISYLVYLIAMALYYVQGNDSSFIYGDFTLLEYIQNEIIRFISTSYKEFLFVHSKLLLPILIVLLIIYMLNKTTKTVRFINFILLSLLSIMVFHFGTFLWGYNDYSAVIQNIPTDQMFYCNYTKFIKLYTPILLLYFLLSISFLVNISLNIDKKQKNILVYVFSLVIFLLFFNTFFKNYKQEISFFVEKSYNKKLLAYIAEKEIIESDDETVYLSTMIHDKVIEHHPLKWFLKSKKIIYYPYLTKVKRVRYDETKRVDFSLITEKERNDLKFSNLLIGKREKVSKGDEVLSHICTDEIEINEEGCSYN